MNNKNSAAKPIERRKEGKMKKARVSLAWINKWCVPANTIVTCSHQPCCTNLFLSSSVIDGEHDELNILTSIKRWYVDFDLVHLI